nr:MAG TPA_asm: hypothetical protein [Bacteriophage sp.]
MVIYLLDKKQYQLCATCTLHGYLSIAVSTLIRTTLCTIWLF